MTDAQLALLGLLTSTPRSVSTRLTHFPVEKDLDLAARARGQAVSSWAGSQGLRLAHVTGGICSS